MVRQSQQQQTQPKQDSQRTSLHKHLQKTKMCVYFARGTCQFSSDCTFAHSPEELKGTPDLHKTRLCTAFAAGKCHDKSCAFAHRQEELRSTEIFYKKTLCMWYDKGRCRNGGLCRFAHGSKDLQEHSQLQSETRTQELPVSALPRQERRQQQQATSCKAEVKVVVPADASERHFQTIEPMYVQMADNSTVEQATANYKLQTLRLNLQSLQATAAIGIAGSLNPAGGADLLRLHQLRLEQSRYFSMVGGRKDVQEVAAIQENLQKLSKNVAALAFQLGQFEVQMSNCIGPRQSARGADMHLRQHTGGFQQLMEMLLKQRAGT